jgi:hypothetical protein
MYGPHSLKVFNMKKILIVVLICASVSCYKNKDDNYDSGNNTGNTNCGTHDGHTLYKDGGGCYYYSDNYNSTKVYVDASECTCD